MKSEPHRRKGIRIMGGLIGLVKPLLPVMFLAVLLGTLGYLCAIFLTILAGYGPAAAVLRGGAAGNAFRGPGDSGSAAWPFPLWRTVLQPFHCL